MRSLLLSVTFFMVAVMGPLSAEVESLPPVIESPTESYTVLSKLGEGLFSEVFDVEDSQGKHFAMKAYRYYEDNGIFSGYLLSLGDMVREYHLGQMFDHPRINRTVEYFFDHSGEKQYIGYLIMELVKGSTLYNTPRESLSREESAVLVEQMVEVIDYVYALDMVYLDLHGNNIMIDHEKNLKLIDVSSFFTFQEIKKFLVEEEGSTSYELAQKDISDHIVGAREKRLQRFFSENPELREKIWQSVMKPSLPEVRMEKGNAVVDTDDFRLHLEPVIMDRVTEACRQVMIKSCVPREERLDFYVGVKRIAWDFSESRADGERVFFKDCFGKILKLIPIKERPRFFQD